jgi:hypothetical protein
MCKASIDSINMPVFAKTFSLSDHVICSLRFRRLYRVESSIKADVRLRWVTVDRVGYAAMNRGERACLSSPEKLILAVAGRADLPSTAAGQLDHVRCNHPSAIAWF